MPNPFQSIIDAFGAAFTSILAALVTLIFAIAGGCSDASRTQQMIDVAKQSGAAYNITLAGKPGLEIDFGSRFALTTGTTVTANLNGGFREALTEDQLSNMAGMIDNLKKLIQGIETRVDKHGARLDRMDNTVPPVIP